MCTMPQQTHLTQSEVWEVVGRIEEGQTQTEVATAIAVTQSVVSRIWNKFLETWNADQKRGKVVGVQ